MPRKVYNALTPLAVRSKGPGRHADGGGLYLLVKASGARSWVYRATVEGKVCDVGLGPAAGAEAVSLAEAREKAQDMAREVRSGVTPMSERRKKALMSKAAEQAQRIATTTFRAAAEQYIALNESGWKNDKHRAQWRSTLETYVYPQFGDLPVCDVDTEHVMAALKPIWSEKPETASRVRGRIETVLDAAKVEGLREGENPARWRGHLDKVLPKVSKAKKRRNARLGVTEHHEAMPYDQVPAFMEDLTKRTGMGVRALEFTILTAARTGETIGATWGEVDIEAAVWTIPAVRMKAEKEHTVPLSPMAVEILKDLRDIGDTGPDAPLFPATKGGHLSNMAMLMQLRRMVDGFTVHGFRSSFRDWAAECTGFPHEVCEMALAHTIRNDSEAAYRRGQMFEKRRKLMDAWATYCATGASRSEEDNVTPLRAQIS
ncbi:site-specific integrase [Erythrobacter westpacificensis]|uniref:Site-specific integrase n=1 Tax=Erythrobacter westpacificensis TaxID=1055231 RepID=A0ABP9KGE8_9SPHN